MTYYFISFDSSKFEDFLERFSIFKDGEWIKSEGDLKNAVENATADTCFFIDLSKNNKNLEKWVMVIRDQVPSSHIIYVTSEQKSQELKAHQLSPIGGDAYVSYQMSPENLERILAGFQTELTNRQGNKLEESGIIRVDKEFELSSLLHVKENDLSRELDKVFSAAIPQQIGKPKFQSIANFAQAGDKESGENMSDKDQELSLDDMEELEISETPDLPPEAAADDQGLEMELNSGIDLEMSSEPDPVKPEAENDLDHDLDLDTPELSFTDKADEEEEEKSGLHLEDDTAARKFDFGPLDGELSSDVKEKLAEIDAIMDEDSKVNIGIPEDLNLLGDAADMMTGTGKPEAPEAEADALDFGGIDDSLAEEKDVEMDLGGEAFSIADLPAAGTDEQLDSDLDQPLVSDDLDLANLDFGTEIPAEEEKPVMATAPKEEKTSTKIKKKKETREEKEVSRVVQVEKPMGQELREISGAYSAELERMQATLSNLRSDREELLTKIQSMEEEKLLHNRQTLNMRAELDEKKIELSIVRKKLNEDISELKDRVRLEEERRLILEEKNRILREELDKAGQKNRIDVKKVQMHERELEQKLELLKADAETQIRNRDLKILELKRKIDAMEFDMESIQTQEKRTVESRFELEDKLEKAIKTLRGAISVLEDETDKGAALEALKKNIDM